MLGNLLWVLVAALIVAWVLGLGHVIPMVTGLIWSILVAAIVLAVLAVLIGVRSSPEV